MSIVTLAPGRASAGAYGTRPTRHTPAAVRQQAPGTAALRLTRRGRAALVLGLLVVLLALGFLFGQASSSRAAGTDAGATVVVQPGDTLWSIAARAVPHRDTRAVIDQLEAVNHLAGASVQVGQRLVLPV